MMKKGWTIERERGGIGGRRGRGGGGEEVQEVMQEVEEGRSLLLKNSPALESLKPRQRFLFTQ